MAMRRRRLPDGRGPFVVEGGQPYVEPQMSRFEVPFVRARAFQPNQAIPEYNPESDLLPGGEGLSGYFEGTRTPDAVMIAREQTEQLRRTLVDNEDNRRAWREIEIAKLEAATAFGVSPETARAIFGVPSPLPGRTSPPPPRAQILSDFSQLPQEQREKVLDNVEKPKVFRDSTGRLMQEIHPQPYKNPAPRPYRRRVPER